MPRRMMTRNSPSRTTAPTKPEFLPHHREDEIGVPLRQEGQPLLGPLQVVGAEQPARADGHLGLDGLVAAAEGVPAGIEEGQDPLLLIALELVPEEGDADPEAHVDRQQHHLGQDAQPREVQDAQQQQRCRRPRARPAAATDSE